MSGVRFEVCVDSLASCGRPIACAASILACAAAAACACIASRASVERLLVERLLA